MLSPHFPEEIDKNYEEPAGIMAEIQTRHHPDTDPEATVSIPYLL